MTPFNKGWLLGCGIAFAALLYILSPVLVPFLIAATLAYLTDPLVNQLQKLRIPRALAVAIIFFFLLLILVLTLLLIIPLLEEQILALIARLPTLFAWLQTEVAPWIREKLHMTSTIDFSTAQKTLAAHWQQAGGIAAYLAKTVTHSGMALFGWVTNLILVPVVMFYLLRDWHSVIAETNRLLPRRIEPVVSQLFKECDEVLSAFFRGQLLVMIALGFLYAFGLWIVGLNVALLIGLVGGLLSIVPYLGFCIGIICALIAAYLQFHDGMHLLYVVIVFGVSQSIEAFFLTPLLLGGKIGLHPVAVIFAILAGGQLFGFVGVLLALPVAAVIMVFVRHFHLRYMKSRLYGAVSSSSPKKGASSPKGA